MYNDEDEFREEESSVEDAKVDTKRGLITVTLDMDAYLGSGSLEEVIAERVSHGLMAQLRDGVQKRVNEVLDKQAAEYFEEFTRKAIAEYFEKKMRKTDQYGRETGEDESLQNVFTARFEKYINAKVLTSNGAESSYYNDNTTSRIQYMMTDLAIKPLNAAIQAEVKKVADAAKVQIQASVSRYIADQLAPPTPVLPVLR